MTISDMKRLLAAAVLICLAAAPTALVAQASQAVSAAAKAVEQAIPPTGPMTALTKAATAVRATRAAALSATRQTAATAANAALGHATTVVGYLWTQANGSIPGATVQLRDTVTGSIVAQAKTDIAGQFVFANVNSGEYAVEYVSNAGKDLVALGNTFSAAPGETIATFVRVANQIPLIVPDLASNVAASAVQTAASAGVTAVVTPIAPVVEAPPPTPTSPPTNVVTPAVSTIK
jgi:hypothetical protein